MFLELHGVVPASGGPGSAITAFPCLTLHHFLVCWAYRLEVVTNTLKSILLPSWPPYNTSVTAVSTAPSYPTHQLSWTFLSFHPGYSPHFAPALHVPRKVRKHSIGQLIFFFPDSWEWTWGETVTPSDRQHFFFHLGPSALAELQVCFPCWPLPSQTWLAH